MAAWSQEPFSDAAQAWLARHDGEQLFSSVWLITEVHSAFARKVRIGAIVPNDLAPALRAFERFSAGLDLAPISSRHFSAAALLCSRPGITIRAPDALHLTVCADEDMAMVTLDEEMAAAARALGVAVETP